MSRVEPSVKDIMAKMKNLPFQRILGTSDFKDFLPNNTPVTIIVATTKSKNKLENNVCR
jgi:hypothetical protein